MPDLPTAIRCGRIVYVWIEDRNGHGKLRPAVILTPDDEISPHGELVVLAITTTFADPSPDNYVALPWHPRGHPVTRLNKRSAAVVNWLASIYPADVVGFGGDVPEKTMRVIHAKLDHMGD